MNDSIRALYEEMILEHNRHPRHFQFKPRGATHHAHGYNPVCNDDITVHLRVRDGSIRDVGFEGAGCAICTASASMMTEAVLDKPVAEAEKLFAGMRAMLVGDAAGAAAHASLGKLKILAGVREYPMRVKCATLPWHTLKAALESRPDTVTTEEDDHVCPT